MKFDDLPAAWELKQERALLVKKRDAAEANATRQYLQSLIDEIDNKLRALGVEPPKGEV